MNAYIKKYINLTTILAIGLAIMLAFTTYLYAKVKILTNNSTKTTRTGVSYTYPTTTPIPSPEEIREEIIKLINGERTKNGFATLKENSLLNQSANLKAKDMLEKKYWGHVSPQGTQFWHFLQNVGYVYSETGENLAENYYSTEHIVSSWMNSPSHKENILDSRFGEIGIGIAYATEYSLSFYQGTQIIVAHFGSQRKAYVGNNGITDPNRVPSRTGKIVPYHDWCNNKNITVYGNEIIVKKSSDGNIYGMTVDDWNCYEKYLKNK